MKKSVTVQANQSMLDIVLTEYGALEAAMEFAFENRLPLSHIPEPGVDYMLPQIGEEKTSTESINYLKERGIVLGTLSLPVLECELVLMPRVRIVPNIVADPHAIGYYSFDIVEDSGFVNTNNLVENYLSDNELCYATEERWLTGLPFETATETTATPMPDRSIPVTLPWSVGLGYMLVWSDLDRPVVTATFRDEEGYQAYCAPLTVLDNISQDVQEHLLGDIAIDVLTASPAGVRVRCTRSHPSIGLLNFRNYEMEWLGMAADGTPDPDDPDNIDKTVVELSAGAHTVGLKTTYYYPLSDPATAYPSSAVTAVINVF